MSRSPHGEGRAEANPVAATDRATKGSGRGAVSLVFPNSLRPKVFCCTAKYFVRKCALTLLFGALLVGKTGSSLHGPEPPTTSMHCWPEHAGARARPKASSSISFAAICGAARRQMDSRLESRVDASDVIQETCLTALASFERFRGMHQGEFLAWLKVLHEHVIQNLARNHVHTQKRSVTAREPRDRQPACAAWRCDAVQHAEPEAHAGRIGRAPGVGFGGPGGRPARSGCRLRYCEAWPLERIASHMERSKPSVAGLLERGLAALRAELLEADQAAESSLFVAGRVGD